MGSEHAERKSIERTRLNSTKSDALTQTAIIRRAQGGATIGHERKHVLSL